MPRWHLYLVRCKDGALYTGIATDVPRRLAQHREGEGAKYLRGKGPLRLVFRRPIGRRGLALQVEHAIKRLSKHRKEELIARKPTIGTLVARARLVRGASRRSPRRSR